jgi:D-specific alpha-keto acid dehydrogenase
MEAAMGSIGITVYGCEQDEADAFRALAPRFGVIPTLTRDAPSERSAYAVPRNRCVSVGHKSGVSAPILAALKEVGVEFISTRSIGCDHIDMRAAAKLGISVKNAPYSPGGVADHTLMLLLLAVRNAKAVVSAAEQHDFRLPATRGRELRDMTVGVIGTGRIGKAVVERLVGFGCSVLTCGRERRTAGPAGWPEQRGATECSGSGRRSTRRAAQRAARLTTQGAAVEHVSLEQLLRRSDVVTLHAPLTPETHHIIGQARIESMRPGAFIINTGRGALIDTEALISALEDGRLGGAALDVLEGEEGIFYSDYTRRSIDNHFLLKLQEMPNVIITPHAAYYTERALRETVEITIRNCLGFERGAGA